MPHTASGRRRDRGALVTSAARRNKTQTSRFVRSLITSRRHRSRRGNGRTAQEARNCKRSGESPDSGRRAADDESARAFFAYSSDRTPFLDIGFVYWSAIAGEYRGDAIAAADVAALWRLYQSLRRMMRLASAASVVAKCDLRIRLARPTWPSSHPLGDGLRSLE